MKIPIRELKAPERELAVTNAIAYIKDIKDIDIDREKALDSDLQMAFQWSTSPEGYGFWQNVIADYYESHTYPERPTLVNTIGGTPVPRETRGILYLCHFNAEHGDNLTLEVTQEIFFTDSFTAISWYAEIPNPESQVITGKSYEELAFYLEELHNRIKDQTWLKGLAETL